MTFLRNLSKRAIAVIIAITVVLSSIAAGIAVVSAKALDIWDGTIADAYAGGTGTQADPYLISTPEQLARMIGYDVLTNYSGNVANGSVDKYYKLTTDIYLNDVSKAKWYEGSGINHWFNAGSSRFCGYFDGAGYTVYGLAFADGATYAALIPFIDSWSADRYVKNVTVSHSYIKGSYAAGITARVSGNNGKTVFYENCYVDDTVIIEATSKAKDPYAGGFVAFTNAGNKTVYDFKNCASLATNPDGTALKYGFVGYNATSYYELFYTINNCFAYANTWQGLTSKGTVVNSYLVSDLATITGEAAKTAMPDLTWDSVWFITSTYPNLKEEKQEPVDEIKGEIWDGTVATEYAGGSGTKADPYQIANGAQLAKFTTTSRSASAYAILTDDIYLNDYTKSNWEASAKQWKHAPVGEYFKGHLDGDGCTIYGLYFNSDIMNGGLIGMVGECSIKDLIFSHCSVSTTNRGAGIIFGRADANGTTAAIIEHVYVDETCKVSANYTGTSPHGVGGFVGMGGGNVTIKNSAFLGSISDATSKHGAFIGNLWGGNIDISNSFTNASVKFFKTFSGGGYTVVSNSYGTQAEAGVTALTTDKMMGSAAKTNMPALDWITSFEPDSDGGYPKIAFVSGYAGNDGEVWSGLIATKFSGGFGTETDPYLISNAEQLAFAVSASVGANKHYKLIADIKLNDTTNANWKTSARNWIVVNDRFTGTLDGDGHTIDGLFYNGDQNYMAFLRLVGDTSVVKNIRFTNASITSSGFGTAVLIGSPNAPTTISKVYIDETCEVKSTHDSSTNKGAAGFVGYGSAALTIEGCAFLGTVSAPANTGGFIGNYWGKNPVITNCFTNSESGFSKKWALASTSANNYSAGTKVENGVTHISADKMLGSAAKDNMPNLDWKYIWQLSAEGRYPTVNFAGFIGYEGEPWEGIIAPKYAGGTGTSKDPYLINTAEQLAKLVHDSNTLGKYYKITADIIINDTTKENWKDTAKQWYAYNKGAEFADYYFQGTLDGNGKTISGLYYNGDKFYVGLFAAVKNGAVIRNVIIADSYLESSNTGGSIAVFSPFTTGSVTFERCIIKETVTVKGAQAAGFASYGGAGGGTVTVETCASYADIEGSMYTAAHIADIWSATIRINNSIGLKEFSPKRAFTGSNNYGLVADKYNTNVLTVEQMKGEAAKKNMPLLNWDRSWAVTDGFPTLEIGEYDGKVGQAWSGKLASKYAGGSGTKDDPYLINTPEQMAKLVNGINDADGLYYKLTADLYINDVRKKNWENTARGWFTSSAARLGDFRGHFDGNGHIVYGLYYNMEQTSSTLYAGLFPSIANNAVVQKLGFSKCHLKIKTTDPAQQTYLGCVAGQVFIDAQEGVANKDLLPTVSQCFGDTTVLIEGTFAGLMGGGPHAPHMNNCYFVGKVVGDRVAALFGNTWVSTEGAEIYNNYSATNEADLLVGGRASVENSASPINYHDNYSNQGGLANFVSQMSLLMMRGDAAKKNMPTLDFNKIWYALPNGTPVLRIFGKTDKFSNTSTPDPIEVSFVTNGGSECESVFGNPEEPIKLPTPTREGYEFAGWYIYKELDMLYPLDTFPYFDTILYAKWTAKGIIEDFEDYPDSVYDYGEDYEYYKPGTVGYNAKYVKNGMAAIHRIGAMENDQDFLLNYINMLEVGKKYKLSFWVTTDKADTKATLSIVHEQYPDVFDNDLGVEVIKTLEGMKDGEWQLVEYTFTAKTSWLAIRSTGNASLYFDNAMILPTDEVVDAPVNDGDNGSDFNIVPIIVIASVIILLIAGAVVAIIIVKKKKA